FPVLLQGFDVFHAFCRLGGERGARAEGNRGQGLEQSAPIHPVLLSKMAEPPLVAQGGSSLRSYLTARLQRQPEADGDRGVGVDRRRGRVVRRRGRVRIHHGGLRVDHAGRRHYVNRPRRGIVVTAAVITAVVAPVVMAAMPAVVVVVG